MPLGGSRPLVFMQLCRARPICLRLFAQETRLAASRTFCTAGTSRPMRMAMIAITTNSSINVKPIRGFRRRMVTHSFQEKDCEARCERAGKAGVLRFGSGATSTLGRTVVWALMRLSLIKARYILSIGLRESIQFLAFFGIFRALPASVEQRLRQ